MNLENTKLVEAIVNRRSIRNLVKDETITKDRIDKILKLSLYAPTAFNMQSARILVLTEKSHDEFWGIVKASLKQIIPSDKFSLTEEKLNGFNNGNGTILFFEDMSIVNDYANKFATYSDMFPNWAQQGNGILQYAVWLSLYSDGISSSIQHYNPLIDGKVKEAFNVPDSWTLIAQMPFGGKNEKPGIRSFLPYEEVVKFI